MLGWFIFIITLQSSIPVKSLILNSIVSSIAFFFLSQFIINPSTSNYPVYLLSDEYIASSHQLGNFGSDSKDNNLFCISSISFYWYFYGSKNLNCTGKGYLGSYGLIDVTFRLGEWDVSMLLVIIFDDIFCYDSKHVLLWEIVFLLVLAMIVELMVLSQILLRHEVLSGVLLNRNFELIGSVFIAKGKGYCYGCIWFTGDFGYCCY